MSTRIKAKLDGKEVEIVHFIVKGELSELYAIFVDGNKRFNSGSILSFKDVHVIETSVNVSNYNNIKV